MCERCGCKQAWLCFNEAPALRGGKPGQAHEDGRASDGASMRPPHYAGENLVNMKVSISAVPLQ